MALAHFQRTFTGPTGVIQPGISVTVRNESTGAVAAIYIDKEGQTSAGNPLKTDATGYLSFYAKPGRYRITGPDIDWRNEDLVTHEALDEAVQQATMAADAAILNSGIYATEADGLAATADGDYFSVQSPEADEYLILYRNDAGTATAVDTYPNKQAVDDAVAELNTGLADVNAALGARVLYVDSIADLLALNTAALKDGQQVSIRGYHAGSDTGSGVLYWNATRPKGDHDGGYIHSPTVPWGGTETALSDYLAGTGEASPDGQGCWVREDSATVLVTEYGAKGDAVADDTSAIRAAIFAASFKGTSDQERTGRTVRFPQGVYVITETIEFFPYMEIDGQFCKIKVDNGLTDVFVINAGSDTDSNFRAFFKFHRFTAACDRPFVSTTTRDFDHFVTINGGWAKQYEICDISTETGLAAKSLVHARVIGDGERGVHDWGHIHHIDGQQAYNLSATVSFEGSRTSGHHRVDHLNIHDISDAAKIFPHDYADPSLTTGAQAAVVADGDIIILNTRFDFVYGGFLCLGDARFETSDFHRTYSELPHDVGGNPPFMLKGVFNDCEFDYVRMYFDSTNADARIAIGEMNRCTIGKIDVTDLRGNVGVWPQLFDIVGDNNSFAPISYSANRTLFTHTSELSLFGSLNASNSVNPQPVRRIDAPRGDLPSSVGSVSVTPILTIPSAMIYRKTKNKIAVKTNVRTSGAVTYKVTISGPAGVFSTTEESATAQFSLDVFPSSSVGFTASLYTAQPFCVVMKDSGSKGVRGSAANIETANDLVINLQVTTASGGTVTVEQLSVDIVDIP